ncbi:hypothetical protein [Cupriavidus sp. UME77]|uniref:hypothetical protein n=1 Tax=Cupriavidus sp. UME77 TaxID=1862321 RepID=UPI0016006780|nr:hypothetical protein [Cupriavidus sp. UME77]MBB1636165.1 hypothetical protein [Cupriavidus sp. UME77]
MSTRRNFLLSTSGAATASLLAATLSACGGDGVSADAPISDAELKAQMIGKLSAELNDATTASVIAPYLMDVGFTWDLPLIPANQVNTIVAYSFGNRPNAASGNTSSTGALAALPDPGPMNEKLADAVYQIYQLKPVKVFAQWQIARFLVSKYQMNSSNLQSIEPIIASDGTITYMSTDGAAAAIVALHGTAAAMGTVAVVGHRDHAKRCIETSVARGMNAHAVKEVTLPVYYDPLSGQPWTRNRAIYLVHDMYAQMADRTGALIAQAYPHG